MSSALESNRLSNEERSLDVDLDDWEDERFAIRIRKQQQQQLREPQTRLVRLIQIDDDGQTRAAQENSRRSPALRRAEVASGGT
jgi:hypothetical protein